MRIFHFLRFVVYIHTIRLIDIVRDIKYITILFTTIRKFSQPRNTGRENTEVICIHQMVNGGASINSSNLKLVKNDT